MDLSRTMFRLSGNGMANIAASRLENDFALIVEHDPDNCP
jgi:hypothetical protein